MIPRSRLVAVAIAAAVTAGAAPGAAAGEAVFLGYGFDDQYQQAYKVKFNQEVDTGNFAFSYLVDMEVTEKCVSAGDSLFLMEVHFDKVETARMQMDNMIEDPMGEKLTGQAVSFQVTRSGVVSDVKPVGYVDGWQQMERIVKPIFEGWYAYLPDAEVEPDGTWERDIGPKEESGLTVSGHSEYRFEQMKEEKGRECAKIKAKSTNTITGKQSTPMGVMNVDGSGKGEGELYFAIGSSTIVKFKTKVEMKMDMVPEGGGDTTGTAVAYSMEREVK